MWLWGGYPTARPAAATPLCARRGSDTGSGRSKSPQDDARRDDRPDNLTTQFGGVRRVAALDGIDEGLRPSFRKLEVVLELPRIVGEPLYNGVAHRAGWAWIRPHRTVIAAMAGRTSASSVVGHRIPAVDWIGKYDPAWLVGDLMAGLTVSAVVIPQAMAYAAIAGLPLTAGLYTSLVPPVVYAFMGTSRALSVTTTSTIAILTAGALQHAGVTGDGDSLLMVAASLTALVGIILLAARMLRLGMVANFISEPVLTGFKAGIGMVIVVDQIPKLLGIHFAKGHFFHNIAAIAGQLPQASAATIVLALVMLALQLGLQSFGPRVPASLMTVVAGIAASAMFGLDRLGIERVGNVRGGMPPFALPDYSLFVALWRRRAELH